MMIELVEHDQDYLRFLWWKDYSTPNYRIFHHIRLVFGLNCSPYLLNAVLLHHFSKWSKNNEDTIAMLKTSFYVDNLIGSICSKESFLQFQAEAIEILDDAKMDLREWHANCHPEDDPINILGISWNSRNDTLFLTEPEVATFAGGITRRTLSSAMQKIFDPLGFVSVTIMLPKLWLQQSWQTTSDWDEPLPDDISIFVRRWFSELPILWSL